MYRKIMVPLDGSKPAEAVIPHVLNMVKEWGAEEVMLVKSVEPICIPYGIEAAKISSLQQLSKFEGHAKSEAEQYLKQVSEQFKKAGVNARSYVITGKAAQSLIDFAVQTAADLVIIATIKHSGIKLRLSGSVAGRLIRYLRAPILIIKPE